MFLLLDYYFIHLIPAQYWTKISCSSKIQKQFLSSHCSMSWTFLFTKPITQLESELSSNVILCEWQKFKAHL